MHALDVEGELQPSERPTIPVPRESGVRLRVERRLFVAATIDVVVCDLSRDARSESYVEADDPAQNESPPSTSTVRALK